VNPAAAHFLDEARKTVVRLAAYFALLAAIGYGSLTLLSAGLVQALTSYDAERDGMRSNLAAMPAPDRVHPALKPKLRGSIEE
jgi:hypothetical protein